MFAARAVRCQAVLDAILESAARGGVDVAVEPAWEAQPALVQGWPEKTSLSV